MFRAPYRVSGLLLLSCLMPMAAEAQLARYDFEGNLDDSIGNYDAAVNGETGFETGNDGQALALNFEGVLDLPLTLTKAVVEAGSYEIQFQSRLQDGSFYSVLFATGGSTGLPFWSEAGFRLIQEDAGVTINYADGTSEDNYQWFGAQLPVNLHDWNEITLQVELELGYFSLTVNGETITRSFSPDINLSALQAGMLEAPLSFAGFDGSRVDPWNHFMLLDQLQVSAPVTPPTMEVTEAFRALQDDLEGFTPLDDATLESHLKTIQSLLFAVPFEDYADALFGYTDAYERLNLPLYHDGINKTFDQLPIHGRVLQVSQNQLLQNQAVAGKVDTMAGVVFEAHEVAPGPVAANAPRVDGLSAEVSGTYHRDIAAELTDQARVVRPTGAYAAPGEVVTVRVPQSAIGHGLSVIVGAHFRNMDYDYIGQINRFPDISTEFPLDSTEIQVINPFGGGIYLKVPEGTDAGWFTMTIDNVVEAPYFSWKAGHESDVAAWMQMAANSGAPWADFESDKFMFTVPTDLVQGISNPDEIMARWDEIMDAARSWSGRSLDRPRAEYYTFDTRLVTPAYGAGYPLVIPEAEMRGDSSWNPLTALEQRPHQTLFHEMGHNHLDPTLDYGATYGGCHFIEAESVNHMLSMSVNAQVYGMNDDDAFRYSSVWTDLTFDEAAFDWIMSGNFHKNLPMIWDLDAPLEDQNQLHYQPRSWAKFGEIARLFGWDALASIGARFYPEGRPQPNNRCPDRPFITGRDDYIEQASEALGVNMAPLFHFWGIIPSAPLAKRLSSLPRSPEIKAMIEHYRDQVAPKNRAEYTEWHNRVAHRTGYQEPRFDHYLATFDEAQGEAIQDQFDFLLNTYFGEPEVASRPAINAGMNDAWYNPETPGQGVFINVFPETGGVFLGWFSYDKDGRSNGDATIGHSGHRWITAFGQFSGNSVFLDATNTRNGAFDDERGVDRTYFDNVARISLVFESCTKATLQYDLRHVNERKSIPLVRVVNDNVDLCEALSASGGDLTGASQELPQAINAGHNDAWYNPSTVGQGAFINVFPETGLMFLGWFTFDVDGARQGDAILGDAGHRWMTAVGPMEGNRATLDVTLTSGGKFNDPQAVTDSPAGSYGTVTLDFEDCANATLSYDLTEPGVSGDIPLQRVVGDNVALCEAIASGGN